EKELYSACDQFLIKQGIEVLNEKNRQPRLSKRRSVVKKQSVVKKRLVVKRETFQVFTLVADDNTRNAVYEFLRSQITPDHPRTLLTSQRNDGSFALHVLISDHFQIPAVHVGEPIKFYVRRPILRGCDSSVWDTGFTITYFNIVLNKYESEWKPGCERAVKWVADQIKDAELEKELYSACVQYLFELGFNLLDASDEAQTSRTVETSYNSPTRYGSDGELLSPKDAYLNSELIVVGATCTANYKFKKSCTESEKVDKAQARERIIVYAEKEVERLFANNVTHSNKEDVLQRAKRAVRFLIDEYYEKDYVKYYTSPTCYGSDGEIPSTKDAYINSELIVIGAAYTADRKFRQCCAKAEQPFDKAQARERIIIYAEEEVERLFANNVTHHNKEDVLQRVKRAARFLIDEYYDKDYGKYYAIPTCYGSDDAAVVEKELLDCTDKYVDNVNKKVDKDHKKVSPITIVQESALLDAKSEEDIRYVTQKYNFTPEDLLKLIAKKSSN
ncbi:35653_t:CDS:2, partial [Gigaspora margarita]